MGRSQTTTRSWSSFGSNSSGAISSAASTASRATSDWACPFRLFASAARAYAFGRGFLDTPSECECLSGELGGQLGGQMAQGLGILTLEKSSVITVISFRISKVGRCAGPVHVRLLQVHGAPPRLFGGGRSRPQIAACRRSADRKSAAPAPSPLPRLDRWMEHRTTVAVLDQCSWPWAGAALDGTQRHGDSLLTCGNDTS